MCKPFPPPLVRGGVFLVGSDTKYRDIADGNHKKPTKGRVYHSPSDTKYRDIADGNEITVHSHGLVCKSQIPSTAI